MNCRKCRSQLVDLLYEELSPRRRRALEAHLSGCADCAREYERLRETRMAFAGIHEPEPPAAIETRIKAAAREEAEKDISAPRWRIIFHPAFATMVLACIAVGVVIFEMADRPGLQVAAAPEPAEYREAESEEVEKLESPGYLVGEKVESLKQLAPERKAGKVLANDDDKMKRDMIASEKPSAPVQAVMMVEGSEIAEEMEADEVVSLSVVAKEEPPLKAAPTEAKPKDVTPLLSEPLGGAGAEPTAKPQAKMSGYSRHVVPYTSDRRLDSARTEMTDGNWKSAKSSYLDLLGKTSIFDPQRPEILYDLAVCHYELKEYKQAQYRLEQLVREHKEYPGLDEALFMLADVYEKQGQVEKAVAVYSQIKDMFPARSREAGEKLEALKAR